MRHLKTFETHDNEIEVGDYVNILHLRFKGEIGKITNIYPSYDIMYTVTFSERYNPPLFYFTRDEIVNFAKTKDELEMILQTKKYNL